MGQQQFLFVILAIIVIGIAIVTGIAMYLENAKSANQEEVRDGLMTVAARAQGWYRRPAQLGGGARSFTDLSWARINFDSASNSGVYQLSNKQTGSFRVTGISMEDTTWSLTLIVYPDSIALAP